jgi:acetyl-CoA C-acetyltransferase
MAALQPCRGRSADCGGRDQISDGASAVLLASEQAVKDHKLTPRARIHHIARRRSVFMLTRPIPPRGMR